MAENPTRLFSITGIIESVYDIPQNCCSLMASLVTADGEPVNIMITPSTYVVDNIRLRAGMQVIMFYDADDPMLLIYPPQHRAFCVAELRPWQDIMMGYFDETLLSYDGSLKLNISESTEITTKNGQMFPCSLENYLLIVFYEFTTRSIPPQTTPTRVIVMCNEQK